MFNNYTISSGVLYLYVDDKCEIGSFFKDGKSTLKDKIIEYIKKMKINFTGTRVVLLLSGLVLGTVYLNNNVNKTNYSVYKGDKYVYNIVDKSFLDNNISLDEKVNEKVEEMLNEVKENVTKQEVSKNESINNNLSNSNVNTNTSSVIENTNKSVGSISTNKNTPVSSNENSSVKEENNGIIISLKKSTGQIINIPMEEYLIGVVAAEMPVSFNIEALKAQAVVARTYTMKLLESNRQITDDVSTQVYKDNNALKSLWTSSYSTYYNKIKSAVNSTKGIYMTYNGSIIDAVYHSTSNGYTEDAVNVWGNEFPYLKSVTSPWDTSSSSFFKATEISFMDLSNKLGLDFNKDTLIKIISRDSSNRISKIKVGNNDYIGVELRNLLGLRSADFDVKINESSVTFTTRGYGHGVGMSQYGANGMANSGYKYDAILKYYYTGINITK